MQGFLPGGSYMNVGLETNYSGSYWETNYTDNHNVKNGSDIWSAWPRSTIEVNDVLGTGYKTAWTTQPTAAKLYNINDSTAKTL